MKVNMHKGLKKTLVRPVQIRSDQVDKTLTKSDRMRSN